MAEGYLRLVAGKSLGDDQAKRIITRRVEEQENQTGWNVVTTRRTLMKGDIVRESG